MLGVQGSGMPRQEGEHRCELKGARARWKWYENEQSAALGAQLLFNLSSGSGKWDFGGWLEWLMHAQGCFRQLRMTLLC